MLELVAKEQISNILLKSNYKRETMEDIKIKLLLKGLDGTISFIEFMQDGKSKILSYDNFIARYGDAAIKSI